jgi:L-2,4-diaminobutyric acid acetyltransferase
MDHPQLAPDTATRPAKAGRGVELRAPAGTDGLAMWELVRAAGGLDLNSPYSYHLWCRDFAASSVIARSGTQVVGLVTGYRRPEAREHLFVWQVAVRPDHRGRGLGIAMLDHIVERDESPCWLEATVAPSNAASQRMFERFADRHGARLRRRPFLDADDFPDQHEPEVLLEIGPLRRDRTISEAESKAGE